MGIFEIIKSIKDFNSNTNKIKLIFFSILTGLLTGLIVSAYTYSLSEIKRIRSILFFKLNGIYFIFIILLFILAAIFIQYSLDKYSLISGSGIPQVMGLIKKKLKFNWLPELILKFLSGLLAIFIGLSMGREGPSIHLGSLIGQGINKITNRKEVEQKYLITAGASAGLAAAFNAPLAGAIFAIEELHKVFTPILMICVLIASLISNVTSKFIFGNKLSFETFSFSSPLNFNFYDITIHLILITLLSFVLVICAKIFNFYIIKFKKIYDKIKLNRYTKISIISLIGLSAIIFMPEITGGGHDLIEEILQHGFTLKILVLLLFFKFIYTMLSYSSGSPGGIFLPLLLLGALVGKIYGLLLINLFDFSNEYVTLFVLIAMTSFFTAIVKTPITGVILILEMSGNFSNLFSLAISATITYAISELLKTKSVYDILYHNMLNYKEDIEDNKMVTLKIPVMHDSKLSNKMIKEIKWPKNLLIVGIEKNGQIQTIPQGDTIINDSDILIFLTDENTAQDYSNELFEMSNYVEENKEIK